MVPMISCKVESFVFLIMMCLYFLSSYQIFIYNNNGTQVDGVTHFFTSSNIPSVLFFVIKNEKTVYLKLNTNS